MLIYKICDEDLWDIAQHTGVVPGMPIDDEDGYMHFSTAEQQAETGRKYFAGVKGLVLLTVDADKLGDALVWEPSSSGNRKGDFPHLYGELPVDAVVKAEPFFVKE